MLELLNKGGWVMYPILLLSVTALAVVIERVIYYTLTSGRGDEILRMVNESSAPGEVQKRISSAEKIRGIYGRVAATYFANRSQSKDILEESVHLTGVQEIRKMEKYLPVLSAIVVIAPLLGLLGTVLGMIDTFRSLSVSGGQPDVGALAGGIWVALLTTAFGLIVAIPAACVHNCFQNLVESRIADIEELVSRLNIISGGGCVSRLGKAEAETHSGEVRNHKGYISGSPLAEGREA